MFGLRAEPVNREHLGPKAVDRAGEMRRRRLA